MQDITITPCTSADIPQLIEVAVHSYNQHYTHLWYDNGADYVKKCFTQHPLEQEFADSNAAFFFINLEEKPVGFLKLNIDKALDNYTAADALELERIYIIQEASGKGIGSKAIDFTVQFAKDREKQVVWLKAMDSSDDAVRFYERNGFQKCGTFLLDKPLMKVEYRGMFVMKRDL
ncbi:GNAT family N-acetyltransferase [Pontibacter harenae]|uniref:GNAT family N-acetyltransferase n=1 Tax=Pontibacter harenae TaxID=2894083 RepID=UPI001E3D21F6|nr:GNAT family N-acetyltransferase [Pontibacter harenae]MCC9168715.1 GNAT family N-acetyltransferase [Pontibacter harenae]